MSLTEPKLRAIKIGAATVAEAIRKSAGIPAGRNELLWVKSNFLAAKKKLRHGEGRDGSHFFFPAAVQDNRIPFTGLQDDDKEFWELSYRPEFKWYQFDRIVVKD
jgi:hypothetical protein